VPAPTNRPLARSSRCANTRAACHNARIESLSIERVPDWLLVETHRVRLLRDGAEAYPAMLAAIRAAEQELSLEMYWIGVDTIGTLFRDALAERARAGVSVRVIYDGVGSFGIDDEFWAPLTDAGGVVHEYRPVAPWRRGFHFSRLFFRDHRKILIVDGRVGFVGGINLADPWLPQHDTDPAWRDDALAVEGPVMAELEGIFARTWRRLSRDRRIVVPRLERPHGRVWALANRVDPRARRGIRALYSTAARSAQSSIELAAAYFLPGRVLIAALQRAARRGVAVRVVVPEKSDVRLVDLACSSLLGKLLRAGVRVFLYRDRILHSKTAVFDRRLVTIGSHNLDALSWRFNLECNIAVDDRAFGAAVARSFELDVAGSRELTLDEWQRRPAWLRWLASFVALFRAFL
jgi:cardiolipin synthase A/B